MRTLFLVLVMLLVALAAGLSFVLPAGAQEQPAATLEVLCHPPGEPGVVLASRELVLVTCTATARNTGPVLLAGAQLAFVPATTLPPPDTYVFWSELRDGVRQPLGEAQLAYDFGDIPPGAQSVIVLDVIVHSTHDFGADAVLLAQPDQRVYARDTVRGAVAPEGAATVPATLTRVDVDAAAPPAWITYELNVMNFGSAPDDDITVELSPGFGIRLDDASGWDLDPTSGHLSADFGELAGNSVLRRRLKLVSNTGGCATARPVLVVTARQAGTVRRQPLIDDGLLLNFCGGGDPTLPVTGSGPTPRDRRPLPALPLAAVGALSLAMAATCRCNHTCQQHPPRLD